MFRKNKNGCFDCDKCPRNHDPAQGRFCVMWWETVQTNIQTGETKTLKSCGFTQLPIYLVEVIKASNRPAAAVESMRNDTYRGLMAIAQAAQNGMGPLAIGRPAATLGNLTDDR